jgi:hypothetical protein
VPDVIDPALEWPLPETLPTARIICIIMDSEPLRIQ